MHNVQWLDDMRTDTTVPAKVRAHLDSATKANQFWQRRNELRKALDAYRLEFERNSP